MLDKGHGPGTISLSFSFSSLSFSVVRPAVLVLTSQRRILIRIDHAFVSFASLIRVLLASCSQLSLLLPSLPFIQRLRAGTSTYYHSTTAGPRVKSWKCSAIIPVRQSRLVIHACVHCSVSQASAGLKKDAWPARPGRSFRMLTCFQVERSPVGDFWLCCSLLLLRLHDTWIGVTWRLISNSFRAVSRGSTARTGTGTGPSLCAVPGNGK